MSDFARAPFIAIWETTRACALRCVHCRAEAIPQRDPAELTTDEGKRLLESIADLGSPPPLVVLTGGDPLRRPDLEELVAHGTRIGLSMSLTPSATGAATLERLSRLRDAGLSRLAVSLDGSTAESHDAFRRVRGSYQHTLRVIALAEALGLPLQVNTTVSRETLGELPFLARQMETIRPVLWALFFLIPVGRAEAGQALPAEQIERVLGWAADLANHVPFGIKTTEAPQYQRVLASSRRGARPAMGRADVRGQCPDGRPRHRLPRRPALPGAPGSRAPERPLRSVRVPERLRRQPRPRLGSYRRSARRRPWLYL